MSDFQQQYTLWDEFEQALKVIVASPEGQRLPLWGRLHAVRRISHNFGYGVGGDMDELLAEHNVDD